MSDEIWIGICLFSFVLATVILAGYTFFLRPRNKSPEATPALDALSVGANHPRAAFLDFFRNVGASFPGAQKEQNPYRMRLQMAGYRWPAAVSVFYGIKCGTALLVAGLLGIATVLLGTDADTPLLPMICGLGFGFLLPDRFLKARVKTRQQKLRAGLPAALDLMILGIEAGQSLDYTIADASRGLRAAYRDLSAELSQLYLELRAGHSRAEAFRNLAERNREPELRKLANLMIDTDRFGTPLAPALRTHARYLRTRFRQHAQETARKVGVKLIFPIFFLIFPSVLLVTLGPACLMMYQQLKAMLT